MRRTATTLATVLLLTTAVASCSMDEGVDSKSAPTKTAASTAAKQPEKLEPIYSAKL